MGEPMTEAEARERFVRCTEDAVTPWRAIDAIFATTDALAVLLDPETMLRAWEKAGKVAWCIQLNANLDAVGGAWRIVPDEEGASRE